MNSSRLAALFSFSLCSTLLAQGFSIGPQERPATRPVPQPILPDHRIPRPMPPQVRLVSQRVQAKVVDGVAQTTVEQVHRNDAQGEGEAVFLFPIPPDAAVDRFTMTMDGKEVAAEVLAADKARAIYEEIVRKRRDPGLLEYMGHGLLRARLFPILAGKDVRVTLRYESVTPVSGGIHEYSFPLRASGVGQTIPEQLSLDLTLESSKGLRNVYTPLAGAEVRMQGDRSARITFEAKGRIPENDLDVFFAFGDAEFGLNMLAHRKPGIDGYFLMMISPRREPADKTPIKKTLVFVLDTSGSMAGKKMDQARAALSFFVERLRPSDSFNIVTFSTEARSLFEVPAEAKKENVDRARALVSELEARGGTNIGDALERGLAMRAEPGSVPMVLFITDGQPTVGTTDVPALLSITRQRNQTGARIFVLGVGNDVNTHLLDTIAEESRGSRDYVGDQESIEVKVSALLDKLAHPAMTEVEVSCDGITGYDLMPRKTPDLFHGDRLLLLGRYRGEGARAIRLKGSIGGTRREFVYETSFPAEHRGNEFIASIWAQRKVAWLLDEIRLKGRSSELVDEVTRLGREYAIVTPFTSHLILEDGQRVSGAMGFSGRVGFDAFGEDRGGRREQLVEELAKAGLRAAGDPMPWAPGTPGPTGRPKGSAAAGAELEDLTKNQVGETSVLMSRELKKARDDAEAPRDRQRFESTLSRRVKGKTFHLVANSWVDGALTPELRSKAKKVAAYSDEYFALLREHADLAAWLAIGEKVVVVLGELVIEIE